MTMHHFVPELSLSAQCPYCADDLGCAEWESHHNRSKMYKSCNCPSCRKLLTFPAGFFGSGHDALTTKPDTKIFPEKSDKKLIELETRIQILSEKIYY